MAWAKAVEKQGTALVYLCTSSAQNVGGNSGRRQRGAESDLARRHKAAQRARPIA
jgi:hypothetical protein